MPGFERIVSCGVALLALGASPVLAEVEGATEGSRRAVHGGSPACAPCHPAQSEAWRGSPHARSLREPAAEELARIEESLLCAGEEIGAVVGTRSKLRFLRPPAEDGSEALLPCRWDLVDRSWETMGDPAGPRPLWGESCAPCHETGLPDLAEHGIGCEACHGPAAAHARNPVAARPFSFPEDESALAAAVCGSCHLQGGRSPAGKPFPEGFSPGRSLEPSFRYPWDELDALGGDRHSERDLEAVLVDGGSTRPCLACHDPHDQSAQRHRLLKRAPICDQCHVPGGTELLPDRETECPVCTL